MAKDESTPSSKNPLYGTVFQKLRHCELREAIQRLSKPLDCINATLLATTVSKIVPYKAKNQFWLDLSKILTHPTVILSFILVTLSLIGLSINEYAYHFPGNRYISPDQIVLIVFFMLLTLGFKTQFGRTHRTTRISKSLLNFSLLVLLISFATYVVQFTPYFPIDQKIIQLQNALNIPFNDWLLWTYHHPSAYSFFEWIYNTLVYQILFIPVAFILLSKDDKRINEFFDLCLFSCIVGFLFYYFFPTTAPASNLNLPTFLTIQYATGIKFVELHQWIPPTTVEGGLIALPSFHAIWSWFCLYLVRPWAPLYFLLLPINILLWVACILLGWHYPLDMLGSIVVILLSHAAYLYRYRIRKIE